MAYATDAEAFVGSAIYRCVLGNLSFVWTSEINLWECFPGTCSSAGVLFYFFSFCSSKANWQLFNNYFSYFCLMPQCFVLLLPALSLSQCCLVAGAVWWCCPSRRMRRMDASHSEHESLMLGKTVWRNTAVNASMQADGGLGASWPSKPTRGKEGKGGDRPAGPWGR